MNTFKQGKTLVSLEEAKQLMKGQIMPLFDVFERVKTENALDRILAEDVFAPESLPQFKKATMDGYALGSLGLDHYKLIKEQKIGQTSNLALADEEAVYVPTGAALPTGTVIFAKVEGCQVQEQILKIQNPQELGPHWIEIGEDVESGELALAKGQKITPMAMGFLSLLGLTEVLVFRKIKIALLTTGDELVPSFDPAPLGKIRDVNQAVLRSLAEACGCQVVWQKLVPDERELVETSMTEALRSADLLITSGASSMGKADVIPELMAKLAKQDLMFHGLNIKPGKPVGLALVDSKPILALPGNPVSSAMTFVVVAEYLLGLLMGRVLERRQMNGILEVDCKSSEGKLTFMPVKLSAEGKVSPIFGKSGLISIVARADGFIAISPNQALKAGESVAVTLF